MANEKLWRTLTVAMGIAAVLLVLVSFGMKVMYQNQGEKKPKIMIRKDSLHRIINQPCDIETIVHISSEYIICERRELYGNSERNEFGHRVTKGTGRSI